MKDILTSRRRKREKALTSPAGDLQCWTEDGSGQVSVTSTAENHPQILGKKIKTRQIKKNAMTTSGSPTQASVKAEQ